MYCKIIKFDISLNNYNCCLDNNDKNFQPDKIIVFV